MSKKKNVATLPVAELVEDMSVYPRHAVDDANVQSLALALESGRELPPVVAEAGSLRLVDGWHRVRARRRVHGPQAVIDVELRTYADEAALVEDAVAMNAAHGRRLDVIDQTRAVLLLERCGLPPERIALAMHVPESRVQKLRVRTAQVAEGEGAPVPGTRKVTLKRSVHHMQGKTLTKDQAEAHKSMPGTSFLLLARQLETAVRTRMIDTEDGRLMEGLRALRDELVALLA